MLSIFFKKEKLSFHGLNKRQKKWFKRDFDQTNLTAQKNHMENLNLETGEKGNQKSFDDIIE